MEHNSVLLLKLVQKKRQRGLRSALSTAADPPLWRQQQNRSVGTLPGDLQSTKGTRGHPQAPIPPSWVGKHRSAPAGLVPSHIWQRKGRKKRSSLKFMVSQRSRILSCSNMEGQRAQKLLCHAQNRQILGVRVCGGWGGCNRIECVICAEAAKRGAVRRKQPRWERGRRGGRLQARPGSRAQPGPPRCPQASRSGRGRGATAAPGSRPRLGPGATRGRRKSPAALRGACGSSGSPGPARRPQPGSRAIAASPRPSPRRPRPRSGSRPRSPGTQTMSGPNSPAAPGLRGSGGGSPAPSPSSLPPPRRDIRTRREPSPLPSLPREPPAAPPPRAKSLYSPLQHGCFNRRRLSAAPQRSAAAEPCGSRTLPLPSAGPCVSRAGPSAARRRAEPGYASPLRAAASARSQRTEPAPPAARAQEGPRARPGVGDT